MIEVTDRQARNLWLRLDTDGSCWEWTGPKSRDGYGRVQFGKRFLQVHRVVYELFYQTSLTPDVCVLHTCDNPSCANPSHLFLGSRADNNRDCKAKGRTPKGTRKPNSRLTEKQVEEILASTESATALAKRYPVSDVTIGKIRRGVTWTHIKPKEEV